MYLVTAIRDIYESNGVEVVGIFDKEEKAYSAKDKVVAWMKENEYEDFKVFVNKMHVNHIAYYEIEEDI